jgi:hypothetical protein
VGELGLFFGFCFFRNVNLPVSQGLGAGPNIGNIRVHPGWEVGPAPVTLAVRQTGRFIVALRDPGLLALALVRGGS